MCSWPRTRRKPFSAKSSAAAPQCSTIFPLRQRFDPARPGLGSRQAAFDQVGRTERAHQSLRQAQPCDCQCFFQAFLQAARRAGADDFPPFHTGFEFFQGGFRRGFGPRSAQTPHGLLPFLQRQMFQHVAQLVAPAALNQRPSAKRLPARLCGAPWPRPPPRASSPRGSDRARADRPGVL